MLVGELIKLGVDLVDVSTGGNWAGQKIPVGPYYQVSHGSSPRFHCFAYTQNDFKLHSYILVML